MRVWGWGQPLRVVPALPGEERGRPGAPHATVAGVFNATHEISISAPSKTNAVSGRLPGPLIYHHLIYIKALTPLIAKTNKQKTASITGRQQAGGRWGAQGVPSGPKSLGLPALAEAGYPPSAQVTPYHVQRCPVGRPALPTPSPGEAIAVQRTRGTEDLACSQQEFKKTQRPGTTS